MFEDLIRDVAGFFGLNRFTPIYSLEQLREFAKLPVVCVLPFIPPHEVTDEHHAGPAVGGLITGLLRRNLLLSRRLSVLQAGDTGEAMVQPGCALIDDESELRWMSTRADVLIDGEMESDGADFSIFIRLFQLMADEYFLHTFTLKLKKEQIAQVGELMGAEVCKLLEVPVDESVVAKWRSAQPTSWEAFARTAAFIEKGLWTQLVKLLADGTAHPDAAVFLGSDRVDRGIAARGRSHALKRDPIHSDLLFSAAAEVLKVSSNGRKRVLKLLRQAVLHAPGHGKVQMCLPHSIAKTKYNAPQILAHSELGYRLLRTNSFAMTNYCGNLARFDPASPLIVELMDNAIRLDPDQFTSYQVAMNNLLAAGRPAEALKYANALVRICTPPISERTRYSFRQSPHLLRLIEAGEFDPVQFAQLHVDTCLKQMK